MNQLEDRLRDALRSDIDVPDLLADVHSAASRRRRRRTAAGVAVIAAVVVAGGLTAASLASDDRAEEPEPIGQVSAPKHVVDVAASGDAVFVLADFKVWRKGSEGWEPLFEFDDSMQYLVASPSGEDLWAWGNQLWVSHDGGRVFEPMEVAGDPTYGYHVWTTDNFVWVETRNKNALPQYFRAPLGQDEWNLKVTHHRGDQILTAGGTLAFLEYPGEDTTGPVMHVSDEVLQAQHDLPLPCDGENAVYPGDTEFFVLCPRGNNGATVYRTVDGVLWEDMAHTAGVVRDVEALSDDEVLVVGDKTWLATPDGLTALPVDLGEGAWDAAVTDDAWYVVTQENVLLVSEDEGRSWSSA